MLSTSSKIILPGGAGLVGQNLVARLVAKGYTNLVVIDKKQHNLNVLKDMYPGMTCVLGDLAKDGDWATHFENADAVVMLQAQIGGIHYQEFVDNNLTATEKVLDAMRHHEVKQLVHISSSVVVSVADDFYTQTKIAQEKIIVESEFACPILRPTLMFGWFDRKHLGWLSRFMQKVPVFPIPGHGRYMRQPLYVGDFCNVIIACLEKPDLTGIYNISGQDKVDYIDIIRTIKKTVKAKCLVLKIPYSLFYFLLWFWALFDRNPPFTTQQLAALTAGDEFEVIDWPGIFDIPNTSFPDAVAETFNDTRYSDVVLEF